VYKLDYLSILCLLMKKYFLDLLFINKELKIRIQYSYCFCQLLVYLKGTVSRDSPFNLWIDTHSLSLKIVFVWSMLCTICQDYRIPERLSSLVTGSGSKPEVVCTCCIVTALLSATGAMSSRCASARAAAIPSRSPGVRSELPAAAELRTMPCTEGAAVSELTAAVLTVWPAAGPSISIVEYSECSDCTRMEPLAAVWTWSAAAEDTAEAAAAEPITAAEEPRTSAWTGTAAVEENVEGDGVDVECGTAVREDGAAVEECGTAVEVGWSAAPWLELTEEGTIQWNLLSSLLSKVALHGRNIKV
jgi:hypothetical protein